MGSTRNYGNAIHISYGKYEILFAIGDIIHIHGKAFTHLWLYLFCYTDLNLAPIQILQPLPLVIVIFVFTF